MLELVTACGLTCLDILVQFESCVAALQAAEPLNTCSIAARLSSKESGLGKPVSAFNGQMGCIYLFADVLSPGAGTTHFHLFVCMSPGIRAHECSVVLVGRLLPHHACLSWSPGS